MENVFNTNNYEYVNLDLPSGTLWATCNIGATKPEEYGLYFQWGAVNGYAGDEAKIRSFWNPTPFNNWASKYNEYYFASVRNKVCPNNVLAPKYDAVFQATSGKAHIPTKEQFKELIVNTTNKWLTVNGVNGRKFTSKKDSTKYIFIPASGDYYFGKVYGEGNWAYLWSSSLPKVYLDDACMLYFDDIHYGVDYYSHLYGCCVRGVID